MRRSHLAGSLVVFLLLAGTAAPAAAQEPGRIPATAVPTRDQVHPELVDSTWGPRTAAAWESAHAKRWADARRQFADLHNAHPQGLEALVGLAFVARATGDRRAARHWYQAAADVEPSEDVRQQLNATEWDRPGSVEIGGEAAHVGTQTVADWSLAFMAPIVPVFSLTGRAGVFGAGDPLRGIFLDSAGSSPVQARVLSIGGVARPTDELTVAARVEYWSSPTESQTFLWIDGTQRLAQHLALRLGVRPLGGRSGAPQISAGADFIVTQNQSLTVEVAQGTRAAPFEPRTQIRAFYYGTPSVRQIVRAGVIRDAGPTNQATTAFASGTLFLNPTFGLRADLSARRGAFERSSAGGGVVFRW